MAKAGKGAKPRVTTSPGIVRWTKAGKLVYWYQTTPKDIILSGFVIEQKGRKFYVVKAKSVDIDRLCNVPILSYDQDNNKIAMWALTTTTDQWQRNLDNDRIAIISEFFRASGNFLVNSSVISVPITPSHIAIYDDAVKIKIPVTWVINTCPKCGYTPSSADPFFGWKFDACPQDTCDWIGRIGQIVDGQHRIRGSATSGDPTWDQPIVTTLLTNDSFSIADMAKIFTEITTSAVDLDALHKLCLLYKFGLRGRNIGQLTDADFRTLAPTPPALNTKGLRNRRAYEISCELCKLPNSRWFDRITMLPSSMGSARRGDIIEADRLVEYLEGWLNDGPLKDPAQPDGMMPLNIAVTYLQDYIEGVLNVWPIGTGTPSGTKSWFWETSRSSNGKLQLRGIFEVFLQLFPAITDRITTRMTMPNRSLYTEELKYIENIDWNDAAWYDLGTPDKNKNMLLKILTHIYENASTIIGASRLPPWVNSWIKAPPDSIAFIATPAASATTYLPYGKASTATPLIYKWESTSAITGRPVSKPINAYENASILVTQMQAGRQVLLLQDSTDDNQYTIDNPPDNLDQSPKAGLVTFIVMYSKGNQTTQISHQHPAV